MKPKTCKNPACRVKFTPARPLQQVCSLPCAIAHANALKAKEQLHIQKQVRREARERKEKIKTRAQWLKEAQQAVNEYVRLRDSHLPCISCGRHHQGQYHAGHYRSVGASPELRFNTLNIHKQCAPCNNHKSGNIIDYRINLIHKIGIEAVEWLEGKHEPMKLTIEQIKAIRDEYRVKARNLKQQLQQQQVAA